MIGLGTLINMAAIIVGTAVGVLVGGRLPQRTRDLITQALGLVVLVVAALNVVALLDADWIADVGDAAPLLIVLGSVVLGGIIGSLLHLEDRVDLVQAEAAEETEVLEHNLDLVEEHLVWVEVGDLVVELNRAAAPLEQEDMVEVDLRDLLEVFYKVVLE